MNTRAAPVEVGEPPGEDEEAGERERVRAQDPLEVGGRDVEAALDRRQRDRDDRRVEDDDELRDAQQRDHRGPGAGAAIAVMLPYPA